jgi:tRNA1(Val) A37 N6-methylase TrmN6
MIYRSERSSEVNSWSSKLAPLLVDFTGLPDTGRVLDVGSGTGALAFSIAELRVH